MGNRKKFAAGITGAIALVMAPFIHNAFSAAASNDDGTSSANLSISTNTATSVPANNGESSETAPNNADNSTKDQDSMPDVSVKTEINNGQTSVTVNGEPVAVPQSGSSTTTTNDNGSHTTITINNGGDTTSTSTTTTSGNTRIRSRTSSSVNINTSVKEKETIR